VVAGITVAPEGKKKLGQKM